MILYSIKDEGGIVIKRKIGYNVDTEGIGMKILKRVSAVTILLSILLSFNVFAMGKENGYIPKLENPLDNDKNKDEYSSYEWTWIGNEVCVQFAKSKGVKRYRIENAWNLGMYSRWLEYKNGEVRAKNRDTYSGKWNQSEDGVKSFVFDDATIPVGPTNIDGVVYAFNGCGELQEGYEYYDGLKTGADGLVVTDNPEFLTWLATQYLPECTSHE